MKQPNTTLSDSLNSDILPAVHANLRMVFPEFGFKDSGKTWQATDATHVATLDGCPKPHQVEVYKDHTGIAGFHIHGGSGRTFIPWVHYVAPGRQKPTGRVFADAVKELARRVGVRLAGQNGEWADRYASNLRRNPAAIKWFTGTRGLPLEYIERYELGLSGDFGKTRGYANAMTFPLFGPRGNYITFGGDKGQPKTAYGYYTVPGVTQWTNDADQRKGWCGRGVSPETYYATASRGKTVLIVVEGFKDLWAMQSLVDQDEELNETVLIISGTHGTALPSEWKTAAFWDPWHKVYLAGDKDDPGLRAMANIRSRIEREVHQILVPDGRGKDWNDFLLSQGTVAELRGLMHSAKVVTRLDAQQVLAPAGTPGSPTPTIFGTEDIIPVDISEAYHNGFLYHAFDMHVVGKSEEPGKRKEGLRPMVLRSDGTIHEPTVSSVVRRGDKPLLRLDDGTVLTRLPIPSTTSTWRGSSMKAFIEAQKSGRKRHVDLGEIVERIQKHFAAQVWLPYAEDYAILALSIVVSYAQEVFDAVPLVLMTGEKGTGKSEIARIASEIGCNGTMLAKATAAAIVENADRSRGFMAVDDFEELGVRGRGGEAAFGNVQQIVKLSYKKATAYYDKMGPKGELLKLRYYGVKLITNTQGVDEIVGSRMLKISTRRIPDAMRSVLKERAGDVMDLAAIAAIRDSLHTWVFSTVSEIRLAYLALMAAKGDRADEIAAPLRVVAKFAAKLEVSEALEQGLARRSSSLDITDEQEALQVAITKLVADGYQYISAPQVINEMTTILGEEYGKSYTTDIPSWRQPHVIGRRLKDDWCEPKRTRTTVQFGYKLSVLKLLPDRVIEIKEALEKAGTTIAAEKAPGDFCRGCDPCSYRPHCSILGQTTKREAELHTAREIITNRRNIGRN